MPILDHAIHGLADVLIALAFRFALFVDHCRKWAHRGARKLRGSVASLRRRWLLRRGRAVEGFRRPRRTTPHNRTPEHLEEKIVRLHAGLPHLGAGQLSRMAHRVLAFSCHRETIRRILRRRRDLLIAIEQERRKRRRRIVVRARNLLWGLDLTLVMVLGIFPVWVLGVVDYHGSRLLLLEPCRPTTAEVCKVLRQAFETHGRPERILSDNGPQFASLAFELFLAAHSIDHSRTRPAHPWTNGRIERLFRTFKQEIFTHVWMLSGLGQLRRFCDDFVQFYNRDRPHSSYGGKTPDEVYFGRKLQRRSLGRVSYFDGALNWYRFG
jgi:putative transposase